MWMLGQQEIIDAVRRRMQTEPAEEQITMLIAGVAVVLVVCAIIAALTTRRRRPARPTTQFVQLREAARILSLSRDEEEDCQQLASRLKLTHPAAMFLSHANFAHFAERMLDGANNPELVERLDRLSLKLFGRSLPNISPWELESGRARRRRREAASDRLSHT